MDANDPYFQKIEEEIKEAPTLSASEISSDSPVFVYKSLWTDHSGSDDGDGRTRFCTFHADDIAYMEQNWHPHNTSLDSVEMREFTCVILKNGGGHLHIDIRFHEVMMRWMVYKEKKNV